MPDKLTIIGAGPGGLFLAFLLHHKYDITIIEQSHSVGGCWRIDWTNNGLFTEHSPKVITGHTFQKLLNSINLPNELVPTYSNYFKDFFKLLYSHLSFYDLLVFVISLILGKLSLLPTYTFTEWFNCFGISQKGRDFLSQFSILLADIPEKHLINDFFVTVSFSANDLYQLRSPEKWLKTLHQILLQIPQLVKTLL